jgi:hypothetical protein
MKRGVIGKLRVERRSLSLAVVMALVLPLLLALLPVPALSADARLERDLAASFCLSPGGTGEPGDHAVHQQCCILCPAGASASLTLPDAVHAVPAPQSSCCETLGVAAAGVPVLRQGYRTGLARGPPSS